MPNSNAVGMTYRAMSAAERDNMYSIKEKGREFRDLCDTLGRSDELVLAKIRLEEAVMWAVKHIAK